MGMRYVLMSTNMSWTVLLMTPRKGPRSHQLRLTEVLLFLVANFWSWIVLFSIVQTSDRFCESNLSMWPNVNFS